MYTKLIKIVHDETGNECVTCAGLGTEMCRIHNQECLKCPMMACIFNQLYHWEQFHDEMTRGSSHGLS